MTFFKSRFLHLLSFALCFTRAFTSTCLRTHDFYPIFCHTCSRILILFLYVRMGGGGGGGAFIFPLLLTPLESRRRRFLLAHTFAVSFSFSSSYFVHNDFLGECDTTKVSYDSSLRDRV